MNEAYLQGFMDKCAEVGADHEELLKVAAKFKGLTFTSKPELAAKLVRESVISGPVKTTDMLNPLAVVNPIQMARMGKQSPVLQALAKRQGIDADEVLKAWADKAHGGMLGGAKPVSTMSDGQMKLTGGLAVPGAPVVWTLPKNLRNQDILASEGRWFKNPHKGRGRELLAHEAFHARNPVLGKSEILARLYGGWKAPRASEYSNKLQEISARASEAKKALKLYLSDTGEIK